MRTLRFDQRYFEDIVLPGGEAVRLRLVRPSDKERLVDGFENMSEASRYNRFLTARHSLTERDLRFLTEVDGWDHFGLAALSVAEGGEERGLGMARFVRVEDEPAVAEPAIAVIDAWQGRGLGKEMLRRLVEAARERDIKVFRSAVLSGNRAMRRIIDEIAPGAKLTPDGVLLRVEFEIPEETREEVAHAEDSRRWGEMRRFLRFAAGFVFGGGGGEQERREGTGG